jgi:DNA invertase Pin-like site-specific DNA recombinase
VPGKRPFILCAESRQNTAKNPQENSLRKSKQHCTLSFIFSCGLGNSMLVGYVRVSKNDGSQTLSPQRDAMVAAGVEPNRIYEDLASGRKDDRPGLNACLKALQPGNTLVVWKLDRLGRDLKHLVITVDELRSRNVGLKVLAGAGAQIDTTTSNGRLFFGIFAALAEFERELISERTQAGLVAARARGRKGGRPRKMDRSRLMMAMNALADTNSNATDVAKKLGITTTTLYLYVNGDGSVKAAGQAILNQYGVDTKKPKK